MSDDLPPIHHQRLELKVSAMESKISAFQASIDVFRGQIKYISDEETKSSRNLKYFITSVITLGVGIFALAGYLNYSVNTAQINDKLSFEVGKVEDKIKEINGQGEIISSSIETPYKRSGYVLGVPSISRGRSDEGLFNYTLKIDFQVRVNIVGDSVAGIIGVLRKYDGDYAKLMASPSNDVYNEELSNGMLNYFTAMPVVEGFPSEISWSESITKTNCKDIEDLLRLLKSSSNIGSVYIKPIFVKMKNKQDFSVFNLNIGDPETLRTCKDFK